MKVRELVHINYELLAQNIKWFKAM